MLRRARALDRADVRGWLTALQASPGERHESRRRLRRALREPGLGLQQLRNTLGRAPA
jgi:hypothetical protein